MEQAVNLFTKCLLMDTSPMVLGNDTLTDVLNGTFVTMNGNEIILLNDMGNRRVAGAYLPAGFEPVGIKEYGGIIYVAAYNPITNLSQIGSFPSPLRKYSNVDNEKDGVEISLNYENGNDFNLIDIEDDKKFLTNDSYLKRLLDFCYIPGDKFITTYENKTNNICFESYFYSNLEGQGTMTIDDSQTIDIEENTYKKINIINSTTSILSIIARYSNNLYIKTPINLDTEKLYIIYYLNGLTLESSNTQIQIYNDEYYLITNNNDIKNRLFSLYYGIINSQNQFIDITNTLKKLSNNHFLTTSFDYSTYSNLDNITWEGLTSDEKNLEENRQKWGMNTYSGKLVGYPYIKVLLNHPVSFRYSYTGKRIKRQKLENNSPVFDGNNNPVFEEVIKLTIVGTIEYNCPDFKKNLNVFTDGVLNSISGGLNYKESYGFSLYRRKEAPSGT